MNIQELVDKYELTDNDFWELRKNSGKWIITHDACEKIASLEGIDFEKPVNNYNIPTIITENGEKVTKVAYGREKFSPAWAGTCQKKTGAVSMVVTGYKLDNPDYKIWTIGEADASNCTSTYYGDMAEKRGKDRVILKLINAYEYGIYSDIEADDFEKQDKEASEKQKDLIHELASELHVEIVGVDKLTSKEATNIISDFKERKLTKEAEEKAKEKELQHGE